MQVRGGGRAIRLRLRQRAIPHPALRATFPSKLGKGSPGDLKCVNSVAAKAGIHTRRLECGAPWIPAFAGMTLLL